MTDIYAQYKKKTFTVEDIIRLKPCLNYSKKIVTKLFKGRKRLTPKQVWNLYIQVNDRIWLLLHLLDEKQRRALGYACLRRCGIKKVKEAYDSRLTWCKIDEREYAEISFWCSYQLCCTNYIQGRAWYSLGYKEKGEIFEKYLRKFGYLK